MRKIIFVPLFMIFVFIGNALPAASTSIVEGYVRDAQTNEPLIGTNVLLLGTSLGSAADINGKYIIRNVPEGSYTIRATYIGYTSSEFKIDVKEGVHLSQDFKLEPVSIEGKTVVVTGQASGQLSAINQQLTSSQIINAVSADRIKELPDANAAESVGRLPGVSVLRNGGEGYQVVIRGLAPKFNAVTIDGVRLSSSDPNDRSTDLSMISSNSLAGIEVAKTVTADMDANVIGGIVNFDLREAKVKEPGIPEFNVISQGSYNGLPSAKDKFRNYKFVGTGENRYFDNRLGVFIQASFERKNLSDNELGASYVARSPSLTDYLTQSITLDDITRDRQRINGVLSLDYKLSEGKLNFANFFSTSTTETIDRQQFYNVDRGNNAQNFNSIYSKGKLNTISNILSYKQPISVFNMNATLSHSYSETKDPNDWEIDFLSAPAGIGQFGFASNLNPQTVAKAADNNLSNTLLQTVSTTYSFTRERILSAALDFDTHINLSDNITTVLKFGGKYQHQTRSYNLDGYDGEAFGFSSGGQIIDQLKKAFPWFQTKQGDNLNVPMDPFIDPGYSYGKFLNGDYSLIYPLNFSRMQNIVDFMQANQIPGNITFNYDRGVSKASDYEGQEDISAAYIMATVNIGPMVTIIPGIRYQQLKTIYTAAQGLQSPEPFADYSNQLVTVTAYHPYWLPDISLRVKPLDWFDVRLSYTNTVSYPDYASLAPIIVVALNSGTLQWNGFKLNPTRSKNYDAYFSFYNNTIGLFTVGAFLKQITDLIYSYTFTPPTPDQLADFYPSWVANRPVRSGIQVTEYVNNSYKINNYGIELDWQTHFWYLPGILSGLVMNVNFTHIFSKAKYPLQVVIPGRPTRYIDSSYYDPLLYQPDDIVNLALGYDYKGFSVRVSSIYSAKIFTHPDPNPQVKGYTDSYNRWDIALKQDLPFDGLQVFCNLNNINSANDVSIIAAPTGVPTSKQSYDYTVDLGLRYKF